MSPWPRDDAKLERVRALMTERDLDALVVRAPDNVLYLTNFWGMKGYDACVFPREGEPALICLEASEEDAARMAWTPDVRLFKGYDDGDPRPPTARVLDLARAASRGYGRVGLELSLGTQASDRMVGEPTTYTRRLVRRLRRRAPTRRLSSPRRARSRREQEIERMRLANDDRRRRDGALQARHRAGHERGADRGGVGGVRPRRGHRLGGEGRARARLLARLVGPGDQDVHGHDVAAGGRGRADALRDLGLRRRLLVRPHEEPRRRRAHAALPRARGRAAERVRRRGRLRAAWRELSRSSTAGSARGSRRSASRASRRTRSATASARVRTSRRTRTRPAAARSPRGWCLQSSQDAISTGGGGLRVEDNFLVRADGAEKLSPFPDGIVAT